MNQHAWVELFDLKLHTKIGTYGPNDVKPDSHSLDLILGIDASQVLIQEDSMQHVFDYDPLVLEIEKLAADCHYETQERLMTRIAQACARCPEVKTINIKLSKTPVRNGSGALGVRLLMDEVAPAEGRGAI